MTESSESTSTEEVNRRGHNAHCRTRRARLRNKMALHFVGLRAADGARKRCASPATERQNDSQMSLERVFDNSPFAEPIAEQRLGTCGRENRVDKITENPRCQLVLSFCARVPHDKTRLPTWIRRSGKTDQGDRPRYNCTSNAARFWLSPTLDPPLSTHHGQPQHTRRCRSHVPKVRPCAVSLPDATTARHGLTGV